MDELQAVALVTGASRGLGRCIAVELARRGLSVAVNFAGDRNAADKTVDFCMNARKRSEQQFFAFQADVGVDRDRKELISKVLATFGRIDALVNNAGIAPRKRFDVTETTIASFDEIFAVNLYAPFFLTQSVANHWLAESADPLLPGGYKVIFISSISADTPSLNRGEYCISKAGLSMVSRLWALRLAELGIQIFEFRPGIMETDMTSAVREKYDHLIAEGLVLMKRWGRAEDVGRALGTVCSGEFPFSTAEVIYLDGGFHLHGL